MDWDLTQDLIDAFKRHEYLLDSDTSEKTWLQRDVRNIDSLIQPGLGYDVVCLLEFVVDVELEGGRGIQRFWSNEESVVISVWMLRTGVERKV